MASPNETVAVFTPGQIRAQNDNLARRSGDIVVNAPISIATPDASSFKLAAPQVQRDLSHAVAGAVNRGF